MTRTPIKTPKGRRAAARSAPAGSLSPGGTVELPVSGGGGMTAQASGQPDTDPGGAISLTSSVTGRIWTYSVSSEELRFSFKNAKDTDFTLGIDAPHFAATLSMLIAAAASNALIALTYQTFRTFPIRNAVVSVTLGEGVTA